MTEATAGPYSRRAGQILRRERNRQGLSLSAVAGKAAASGFFTRSPSAPSWRSWEAGERGMSLDTAVPAAKTLGIPPASLLPRDPDPDIDEGAVAAFTLILENKGAIRMLARLLAAAGAAPPGRMPAVLDDEGGEGLALSDREVDLLEAVVLSLRAQQRERDTMPTEDPGGDA